MKSYEEISESLFKRRDIYIEQQIERRMVMRKAMNRTLTSLGCVALAVALGIGVWQAGLFKESAISTPESSTPSSQQAVENNDTNQEIIPPADESEEPVEEMPEALGGDGAWWIFYEYTDQYNGLIIHGIPADVKTLVDEEVYKNWANQFWFVNKETYTRTDAPSIIKFLDEVGGITKEQFMTIDYYTEYLTQEEIDLIFSEDHVLRDQSLVSPYAVFANGRIYTARWLDTHNAEDYIAVGMTKAQLLEKVPAWDEMNYGDLNAFINLDRIVEEINKMP